MADPRDHGAFWFLMILSLFLPLIGLIWGAVYMTKPDPLTKAVGRSAVTLSLAVILAGLLLVGLGILPSDGAL